jgi:hypothetical protein
LPSVARQLHGIEGGGGGKGGGIGGGEGGGMGGDRGGKAPQTLPWDGVTHVPLGNWQRK